MSVRLVIMSSGKSAAGTNHRKRRAEFDYRENSTTAVSSILNQRNAQGITYCLVS